MAKIALFLPGNSMHSNVLRHNFERMDRERAGLDDIGKSDVKVSISYQGIDYEILPWLRDTLGLHPSIEVLGAPHTHALIPHLHPKQGMWEIDHGVDGKPAYFFAEFYTPTSDLVPGPFFVLESQTVAYSYGYEEESNARLQPIPGPSIGRHEAISYKGRIGLVMKNLERFLDRNTGFFGFNRGAASLDTWMRTIEDTIADTSVPVHFIPIDIEAPYVGSIEASNVWKTMFDEIARRGLAEHFIWVSEGIKLVESRAVASPRPYRRTGEKWTKYEEHLDYIAEIKARRPDGEREHRQMALATPSDVLSGICSKLDASSKVFNLLDMDPSHPRPLTNEEIAQGLPKLTATSFDGTREEKVLIGYSQDVLDTCYTAKGALARCCRLVPRLERLSTLRDSLLLQRVHDYAVKYNL